MKEETKPGPLSAGLGQGKDIQGDHHLNFEAPGELGNFLARRQLLTMERMRIEEVLLEAETRVKAEQDHLVSLRNDVLEFSLEIIRAG